MENIKFPTRLEYGETFRATYELKMGFIETMRKFQNQDVTITAIVSTTLGEKFHSNEYSIDELLKYTEKHI